MENSVLILIFALAIINIAVSIFLFRRDDLEKFQKVGQTIVVWLLPFVGALIMWVFNRSQEPHIAKQKKPLGGEAPGEHHVG
ncbi:hypothetical protein [Thalassotalea sp. PP2-459]|uniref:hypothetical protein n=1 Tax=Thalassotalea sp. PP2-459 TaxID=1742724 RepID=UPI0009448CF4|nr:hypothetical protein [Thalassotalea sp. PP2-459]OKY24817.1 hypothetical protein BI291_17760 [Thalassotalea sp. PP2-459]